MNKEKTPSCLQLSYDSHLELDLPLTDQPSLYWSVLRIGWRDAVTSCFCWEKSLTKKYFYIYPLEVRKVTFLKVCWGLKRIPASQEPSAMIHYPIQSWTCVCAGKSVPFLPPLSLNRGMLWTLCCAAQQQPCPGLSHSHSPLFLCYLL